MGVVGVGTDSTHNHAHIQNGLQGISGKAALDAATSGTAKRTLGEVKLATVYRSLRVCNDRFNKFYEHDFCKIPNWCHQFTAINPGSIAVVNPQKDGRFRSVFVGFKPMLHAALKTGLGFMGVDAG